MNKKRNIVEWAMHYRQIIIMVVCSLIAFGIYSLPNMRKNEFPDFTIRQGIVVAVAPGNTAEEMEQQVTKPLENYIFTYKEVKKEKTFSMSRDGIVYIQVQLNDDLNTENYYWQTVMLKEKLKTLDQVEKQLEEVRKDAQAAVDAGIKNRNDLLQVKLRHNETRTSKIEVENTLQTVCDMLAQVMGHSGENIDVYNMMGNLENPRQLFVAPESALQQTHEYQLLDKQVEADQLQYKLSVGKNLPSVAVGGSYIYNHLMDKSQNNLVGVLTVSVPISSWWGGSHDMKRQKLQVASAIDAKQNQSELLIIRMRKAWNDLNDAYKQVAIAQESIEQSEENLRLNTDYYQAGTSTISDVLDAQTLYQQSRDQYVESIAKYEVKKREYLQATGR